MCFQSKTPFTSERIHAAAMYCSDGRFGEPFDDFLTDGLHLPRYDRVAIPGGPACLAGYPETRGQEQEMLNELLFLLDAHSIKRVVLIQHQGCAFYGELLDVPKDRVRLLQEADLVRAAHFIRRQTPLTQVEGYFAAVDGSAVKFERVDLD